MSLNATGTQALLDQQTAILRGLAVARVAMNEASPHPRDYPDLDAYQAGMRRHVLRSEMLLELMNDVTLERKAIRENGGQS